MYIFFYRYKIIFNFNLTFSLEFQNYVIFKLI